MNEENALLVFTARSPERIIREGGSQRWVLNPARAKLCTWLVCTQNRHNPDHEFSDATEAHGSGFLLCRISGVRISTEADPKEKWLILISEFARINYPNLWDHGRNPIRYTSLETLRIDPNGIEFQAMPNISEHLPRSEPRPSTSQPATAMREKAPFSSYAREKFWQAVDVLATSDRSIQQRLAYAAQYLIRLKPDDLPEEHRGELNAVLRDLTKETAAGEEGTIEATTRQMTSEEGTKVASRILSVYTELHGGI
jgi:hypothetical protein